MDQYKIVLFGRVKLLTMTNSSSGETILGVVSLTEINHKAVENTAQDQTARVGMLILLYTLHEKKKKNIVASVRIRVMTDEKAYWFVITSTFSPVSMLAR